MVFYKKINFFFTKKNHAGFIKKPTLVYFKRYDFYVWDFFNNKMTKPPP